MTPHTHPGPGPKSPEPALHFDLLRRGGGEPASGVPGFGEGEDEGVAVEGVGLAADAGGVGEGVSA